MDVVATGLEAITASSARLAGTAGAASPSSVAALRVERAHRRREMFARGVCAMNAGAREVAMRRADMTARAPPNEAFIRKRRALELQYTD